MNKLFNILFLILSTFASSANSSEIYSPFYYKNPNKLDSSEGYCANFSEEAKLWQGINKYANSLLTVMPAIPPEQKKYIQQEVESGNVDRALSIRGNPFFIMNDIYQEAINIEKLSSLYLLLNRQLPLEKKVEITARVILNIDSEKIDYSNINWLSSELKSKGYYIAPETLKIIWGTRSGIKQASIFHLICYGEKYK